MNEDSVGSWSMINIVFPLHLVAGLLEYSCKRIFLFWFWFKYTTGPGGMFEDKMTPGEQASTWVTRYEYESNCLSVLPHFITLPAPTRVLWSTLPLHLAVALKAPFITVGRLVEREYIIALNLNVFCYP